MRKRAESARLILDFRSSGPGENADLTRGTGHFNLAQGAVIIRTPIVQALARHKAAQAALDAVPGPEDYPEHLC
ncbi:MAG: hypothetical protein WCC90_15450, partial [Methylocella sp.]